jgi:hypothetical protein
MEKILPVAVSEAHGRADLHVHDLDKIHHVIERVRDLDLEPKVAHGFPVIPYLEESEWDRFIHSWESEENRLLGDVGRTLVWNHVNAAIAFYAQSAGMEIAVAVSQILKKICRRRPRRSESPTVTWRMQLELDPRWRGRFIGARQLSLLPEDEVDTQARCVLLEILRQVQEIGPFLSVYGLNLEVVLPASLGQPLEKEFAKSVAECMSSGAPLRLFFERETSIGRIHKKRTSDLVQIITLNFPRAASIAGGSDDRLVEWLEDRLALIAEAHVEKRAFLERLGRLSSRETSPEFGVGVWGLVEMTLLHIGKNPREDDEALKWLLEIVARIRLRLEEIANRKGLSLSLVQSWDEALQERLGATLPSQSFDQAGFGLEGLLGIDGSKECELIKEGKLHPFFHSKQIIHCRSFRTDEEPEQRERWLQTIASATHLSGVATTGVWTHCASCGQRFTEPKEVCLVCGGQDLYRIDRRNQGKDNRIARL